MHVNTAREYSEQIINFVEHLGFATVGATVITDHSATLTEFQSFTNAPAAYLDNFYDLPGGRTDPVSQHCKQSSAPIVWNQDTYVAHGTGSLWEFQAPFGYRNGVCVAGHFANGRHFMFGAQTPCALPINRQILRRLVEDFQEFASYAQAAAFELAPSWRPLPQNDPELRTCEMEALRWTMDGNTSQEVGAAMGVSAALAELYIRKAMRKLDCATKYEAVLKAIRAGLIVRY